MNKQISGNETESQYHVEETSHESSVSFLNDDVSAADLISDLQHFSFTPLSS